jgi:hypothetical protein
MTGFGLDDWIYCTLYVHTTRDWSQFSAIAILHTFQFTVAHAAFTSRILATELQQSVTSNHIWSLLFASNSFLVVTLQLQIPKTQLNYSRLLFSTLLYSYYLSARTPLKTPSSVAKEACLQLRYLAMDVLLSRARMLWECVHRLVA